MAIAQNGLTYAESHFDTERYEQVRNIGAEMMAEQSGMDHQRILDLFAGEVGYATPKVDVRGVVFRDDCILLVKERADGLWTLPGGWADVNESPKEAVVREVEEESGYRIADWSGECPIRLDDGRYFLVVGALLEGRYAILDSAATSRLVPSRAMM
jgi:hypothetical protein